MFNRLKTHLIRTLHIGVEKLAYNQSYNFPFGKEPLASENKYKRLAMEARNKNYPEVDSYEYKSGYAIDQEWLHELALHTQVVIKKSELCYQHGRILYTALSQYLNDHPLRDVGDRFTVWETGTARGFSTLCMAKALADQGRAGTIVTFDFLPHRTKMYWNCIDDHDKPKSRAELLEPWKDLIERYIIFHQGDSKLEMPMVQAEHIHFAFLDGSHKYNDVVFEFQQIYKWQKKGDIIVCDDYTPELFPEVVRAVDEMCEKYDYSITHLKVIEGRGYVVSVKE